MTSKFEYAQQKANEIGRLNPVYTGKVTALGEDGELPDDELLREVNVVPQFRLPFRFLPIDPITLDTCEIVEGLPTGGSDVVERWSKFNRRPNHPIFEGLKRKVFYPQRERKNKQEPQR